MKCRLAIVVPLLLLAGCGASTESSSAEKFKGEERAVAQKVEELQRAGERREPETICTDILAKSLVQQLEAAGADCTEEMRKAIEDADDYALDVTDVTISGSTATAKVRRGDDGPTETMEFTQEGGQWRATSLSGA
jgi:dihydroxyacetone kinase